MANTLSKSGLDVVLDASGTFFHQKFDQIQAALAKRKIYQTTFRELSQLSDRDLQDLGIARFNIKTLAMEAAYGS